MGRRSLLAFAALAAALSLAACADVLDPPAATVEGEPVPHEELRSDVRAFQLFAQLQGGSCGQAQRGEAEESACARAALSNLIAERLTLPTARDLGVTVPQAQVDREVEGFLEQAGRQQVEAGLQRLGLDLDDLRDVFERFILSALVREAITAEELGEDELLARYEERRIQFLRTYHAAHILLPTLQEAEEVRTRLTPENFAELAAELSQDPGSGRRGGDLGTVGPSDFVPEFTQAAIALEPGEISDPVQTQFGFHLIMLIEVDLVPFEQARVQLIAEVSPEVFGEWFRERIGQAEVEVNPRFGRFDPSTGQVLPRRSTEDEPVPAAS